MNNSIKINDLPQNERPMEKMIKLGAESLSNAELIAILLRTGTKGENIIALSTRLLSELNGLDGILTANLEDTKKIKGIKNVKACQIIAISELFKRFKTLKSQANDFKVSSPKDVAQFLINEMEFEDQEVLKLILLGTKNNIISIKNVFKGGLNSSVVHPREIFREAVKVGCANIIIAHNHPSGDPTPSREDINISIRIKECGEIMGIKLLDHIIVGKSKYVSLKEKGII